MPPYASATPVATPAPYAPGVLYTTNGISFSADGNTLFVGQSVEETDARGRQRVRIMEYRFADGAWSEPVAAPFSTTYTDYQPVLNPTGDRLFFTSTRPAPGTNEELRQNIWSVERQPEGWGEPEFHDELATPGWDGHAVPTRAGRLYFVSDRAGGFGGVDIWSAERAADGRYVSQRNVATVNSRQSESDLFVDPDERFMIFYRDEPQPPGASPDTPILIDLYIAFAENNIWQAPRKLDAVNGPGWELSPMVTPDGRYLLFSLEGTLHRVDFMSLLTPRERALLGAPNATS